MRHLQRQVFSFGSFHSSKANQSTLLKTSVHLLRLLFFFCSRLLCNSWDFFFSSLTGIPDEPPCKDMLPYLFFDGYQWGRREQIASNPILFYFENQSSFFVESLNATPRTFSFVPLFPRRHRCRANGQGDDRSWAATRDSAFGGKHGGHKFTFTTHITSSQMNTDNLFIM